MRKIKIFKRIISFTFVVVLSFILARHFFYEAPILMYHRIASFYAESPLLCVSPPGFKKQMDFISRRGYKVISLEELVEAISERKVIPRNTVVITFDDGTADIYQNALAVLKQYGFPATIFMVSGYIGKEKFLSLAQLKEMQNYGIDIASHTQTHVYLPDISDEQELWNEIFGSKQELESKTGRDITLFSYPIGGYNTNVIDFVKMAGYKGACTTNRGRYRLRPDVFALRRIKMTEGSDNPWVMWIKLSGIYNLFRRK